MKIWAVMFCTLFLLVGCQLTRVEGKVNDVDVKVRTNDSRDHDHDYDHDSKFCPPGQAKKGNC